MGFSLINIILGGLLGFIISKINSNHHLREALLKEEIRAKANNQLEEKKRADENRRLKEERHIDSENKREAEERLDARASKRLVVENRIAQAKLAVEHAKAINIATEGLSKTDKNGAVVTSRLAALYTLEQIASATLNDHIKIQIIDILCAYVRHNSPIKKIESYPRDQREDITLAIAIIGRRDLVQVMAENKEEYTIDLSNSDLFNARFNNARLDGALLYDTDLSLAWLLKAELAGATLDDADLNCANLCDADLTGAHLSEAILTHARLMRANLTDAFFDKANLTGAHLMKANLTGAFFEKTNMKDADTKMAFAYECDFLKCKNLTQDQLDVMFCGKGVKIPSKLKRPKHWPTKELSKDDFLKAHRKWQDKKYKEEAELIEEGLKELHEAKKTAKAKKK